MSNRVHIPFAGGTLIIDGCNVFLKEVSTTQPIMSIDMYYCTQEGKDTARESGHPERACKPAILLYDNESDDPIAIIRHNLMDGSALIEAYRLLIDHIPPDEYQESPR